MKRMLSACIAIALVLSMIPAGELPVAASAEVTASGVCGDQLTWTLDNGTLTISGSGNMDDYYHTWSNYIEMVYAPWYDHAAAIERVIVEDGVTGIGDEAFFQCENLTEVTIGKDVKSVGDCAFRHCAKLKKVDLPDGVTRISRAFYESGIEEITVPGSVKTIEAWAFKSCNNLKSVTLCDGVEKLGQNLFEYCYNLETVYLSNTLKNIPYLAFRGCYRLAELNIPDSVMEIGDEALDYTAWYSNQPEGLVYAGKVAYKYKGDCPETVTIKEGTLGIAAEAFRNCTQLKEIVLPESLKVLCSTFDDCTALEKIALPDGIELIFEDFEDTAYYKNEENWEDGCLYIGKHLVDVKADVSGRLTIKEGTKTLAYGAVENCKGITEVVLPEGLVVLSSFALSGLANSEIRLPQSLKYIGYYAFWDTELDKVIIPDSVETIEESAFNAVQNVVLPRSTHAIAYNFNGESLKNVVLPKEVTRITSALSGSENLTVWYTGSEADRKNIDMAFCENLEKATWYYNICPYDAHVFEGTECKNCAFTTYSLESHIYDNECDTVCNECGAVREVPHEYHWVTDLEPTCQNAGSKHEQCWWCGAIRNAQTPIPATGQHTYSYVCDTNCDGCGMLRAAADHVYDSDYDATCNVCEEIRSVPEHTHAYVWVVDKAANCSEDGIQHEQCSLCHITRSENTVVKATGEHICTEVTDTQCNTCGQKVFQVIFEANGGAEIAKIVTLTGKSVVLPAEAPARSGYRFAGWSMTRNGDGMYQPGDVYIPEKTVTLYAQWDLLCEILYETVSCKNCYGLGEKYSHSATCSSCKGTGVSSTRKDECYYCDGSGRESTGTTNCSSCGGDGIVGNTPWCMNCSLPSYDLYVRPTSSCLASGHTTASGWGTSCSNCGGDGKISNYTACSRCDGTGINDNCYSCSGTGRKSVYVTCTACSGTGKEEQECAVCHATGVAVRTSAAAPAAPTLKSTEADLVELNAIDGGEYSLDGITWQDSPVFQAVAMGERCFYQRLAKTDMTLASPASEPLVVLVHEHTYDHACDTTCNLCDKERSITHTYDHACDPNCNVCDALRTELTHTYDNACDPQCNVCGLSRVPADHVYDHSCDTSCNECGQERATVHTYCSDSDTKCDVCGNVREVSIDSYYEYAVENGEATITDVISTISGDIVIPDSLYGYPVTAIGDKAFQNCYDVTSVTMSDQVTTIGSYAFYNCSTLTDVAMGNAVTQIGSYAFAYCDQLKTIAVPSSIMEVGDYAFDGCDDLTYNIYDNGRYLGNGNDPYVVLISATSTDITECELHPNTKVIYHSAFSDCKQLVSVSIPGKVTQIGNYAFQYCEELENIVIPDRVTDIGNYAFRYCKNLTAVTIGNGVTRVGSSAFYECEHLTSVTVGKSVKSIGSSAFYGCERLAGVYISDIAAWCQIVFDNSNSNPISYANKLYLNNELLTDLTVPEGITTINSYALYNCDSLTSVVLPNDVTNIKLYAFAYCDSLRDLFLGNCVQELGEGAFDNCDSLSSVAIPDSVVRLGAYAFRSCNSMTSVTIGEGVTSIGKQAFKNCTGLESIVYNAILCKSAGSSSYPIFEGCANVKTITVGEKVHTLMDYVFRGCDQVETVHYNAASYSASSSTHANYYYYATFIGRTSIKTVTFGEKVELIPSYLFKNCTGLETVNFNAINCTDSSSTVFTGCTNLKTVNIGQGVTRITDYLFNECQKLESVTIPGSVQFVGTAAFSDCSNLKNVTIQEGVYTISSSAFENCTALESITFPDSVQYVYHSAFSGCTSLSSITIGDGLTELDDYVFADCGVQVVSLPKSLKEIGCGVFENCLQLTDVWYPGTEKHKDKIEIGYGNDELLNATWHCAPIPVAVVPQVHIALHPQIGKPVLTWQDAGEEFVYRVYRAGSKNGYYYFYDEVKEPYWEDTYTPVGYAGYYKVRTVWVEDREVMSDYSPVVSLYARCATPKISVTNDAKGKPTLTWEKVSGAKKYTLYRATSENGKYTKIGSTTKDYYTDSKVKAGTTYFYKIIANASKSAYNSLYSNIISCGMICGTPSVSIKIDTNTGKPSLSWKKVDGAAKYAIYRDGQLLTTTTNLSFNDETAAIDTQYTYAVQALGKTESLNGQLSKAVSATSGIAKPAAKGSVDTVSGKPVITWQAVEGAVKYEVYRSTKSSKSYKLVATVETLSYTDETVSAGKTYYYKVKAIGAVSKSTDSSYVKLTGKCATPEISASNDAKGKPYITWAKVSGAKKYTIYRATSETGKYKKLGTTTKAYYTDSKASAGTTYFYKIVANASSSKNNSPYSNIVSCGVNCATPVVKIKTNASGHPVLSWAKVSGAVKYEIYLLGAEDYVTLATVSGTSWTDEGCAIDEGRYYGVRAIAAEEAYNSEVSAPVFGRGTCATPKLSGKVGGNKKPVISWNAVDGATKYVVYRSTSKSKGYNVIGESETLTYEDLTAKKGKTYYYKVVAVSENSQSAQSSYVKVKSK